ncbi:hypothetical protein TSAR_007452, partial [Trichomalopsis sarcophagae]
MHRFEEDRVQDIKRSFTHKEELRIPSTNSNQENTVIKGDYILQNESEKVEHSEIDCQNNDIQGIIENIDAVNYILETIVTLNETTLIKIIQEYMFAMNKQMMKNAMTRSHSCILEKLEEETHVKKNSETRGRDEACRGSTLTVVMHPTATHSTGRLPAGKRTAPTMNFPAKITPKKSVNFRDKNLQQ